MRGVHEDEVGSRYLYSVYRRGDVVRKGDSWGVVLHNKRGNAYHPYPTITWLQDNGEWLEPTACEPRNISAPFADSYEGIPDEVWGRAAYYRLVHDDA